MTRDLKDELASLRIEREAPRKRAGGWLIVLVALAGWVWRLVTPVVPTRLYATSTPPRSRRSNRACRPVRGPNAGTPILTASGYLVARTAIGRVVEDPGTHRQLCWWKRAASSRPARSWRRWKMQITWPPSPKPRPTSSTPRPIWPRRSGRCACRKACSATRSSRRTRSTPPSPRCSWRRPPSSRTRPP